MGVALICWGRFFDKDGNKVTVLAPTTEPDAPWLWNLMKDEVPHLAAAGFSVLQLPPVSKAQGGAYAGCDGYGVFDRRDIGSKNQQGGVNTRYGSAQMLRQLVAVAHAHGMEVYNDFVLHQLMGANGGPGVFNYLGADGVKGAGRGAMTPGCFRGIPPANRPADPVPVPADDFEFGCELVYQNCDPPGYTIADAIDWGDWIIRTLDLDGGRFDDTKGTNAAFVHQWMTSKAMADKFFYSEYFDGNPSNLDWWATTPPMNRRSSVADFTLHWALQGACDGLDAQLLDGAGYVARNPYMAVTFVDNPDTDTSYGEQVISNKLLAYAFILTAEGYPFVYGKDYYPSSLWPGAYGLQRWIDNLVWIHETFASGGTIVRWVDDKVIVFERQGKPGLLTALNFDNWNARTVTVATSFGANAWLHDYTGHHYDNVWTDGSGNVTFEIPSNAYNRGQSYLCWSLFNHDGPIERPSRITTQTFFGVADLDIGPAKPGVSVMAGRLAAAAGHTMTVELNVAAGMLDNISVQVLAPDGSAFMDGNKTISQKVTQPGWYTFNVVGIATSYDPVPFELTVSYMGSGSVDSV